LPIQPVGTGRIDQLLGLGRRENLLLYQASQLGFQSAHHHILARK
jgi:hypothetical protein